jgi:squalene-associated FAD-dependent desaturase
MIPDSGAGRPRVAIIGGGLAGLAAATKLCSRAHITLFEARSKPGGRAGAFVDAETAATLDLCQHVAMGCCTHFLAILDQWGIRGEFQLDRVLHFLGPGNELCRFEGSRWLPPPLHLSVPFARLRYFTWRERLQIGRNLLQLWWTKIGDASLGTIGTWLAEHNVSDRVQELFWQPVIESALSENLSQASFAAARKVFVEGFLTARRGYELWIPRRPLTEILQERVLPWLTERGVVLRMGTTVTQVERYTASGFLITANREQLPFDQVIIAVPWTRVESLLGESLRLELPELAILRDLPAAPIVSVHLWYDRPLTILPHVVLPGRISQWLFAASIDQEQRSAKEYGYQVVISAAYDLLEKPREQILYTVSAELKRAFPQANATLVRSRVIIEPRAVFAPRPEWERRRLSQQTNVPGLILAGDWTDTGWPATMEGAIRSGELAANIAEQGLA